MVLDMDNLHFSKEFLDFPAHNQKLHAISSPILWLMTPPLHLHIQCGSRSNRDLHGHWHHDVWVGGEADCQHIRVCGEDEDKENTDGAERSEWHVTWCDMQTDQPPKQTTVHIWRSLHLHLRTSHLPTTSHPLLLHFIPHTGPRLPSEPVHLHPWCHQWLHQLQEHHHCGPWAETKDWGDKRDWKPHREQWVHHTVCGKQALASWTLHIWDCWVHVNKKMKVITPHIPHAVNQWIEYTTLHTIPSYPIPYILCYAMLRMLFYVCYACNLDQGAIQLLALSHTIVSIAVYMMSYSTIRTCFNAGRVYKYVRIYIDWEFKLCNCDHCTTCVWPVKTTNMKSPKNMKCICTCSTRVDVVLGAQVCECCKQILMQRYS